MDKVPRQRIGATESAPFCSHGCGSRDKRQVDEEGKWLAWIYAEGKWKSAQQVRRKANSWSGSTQRVNGKLRMTGEDEGKWLAWLYAECKWKLQNDS